MTVQTTNTQNSSIGDGVTVLFNFTFQSLSAAWVKAQTITPAGAVTNRTDITVALNADQEATPGGTVTFDTAPVSGHTVRIYRDTPLTQGTDYTDYDAFPAESHEDALDKLTMITQENNASAGGGDGPFLELAGGTMDSGSNIDWFGPSGTLGRFSFKNLLTIPSFLWGPKEPGVDEDVGYVWSIGDGVKSLAYSPDGILAIEGRPAFAGLPGTAIATKDDVDTGGGQFMPLAGGTWAADAVQTFTEPSVPGSQGGMTIVFEDVLGVPALLFEPDGGHDIGFLFSTQLSTGPALGGNIIQGWQLTNQIFTNPDNIATVGWVNGLGFITDAPSDGFTYGRRNAAWVTIPPAPADWQIPVAAGFITPSTAGAPTVTGTLRGCTVQAFGGTGQGQITLSSAASSIANIHVTGMQANFVGGIDVAFNAVSTTVIEFTVLGSVTGAATNGPFGFTVWDRG